VCSKPSQTESLSKHIWVARYRSISGWLGIEAYLGGSGIVFKTEPSQEPIEASGWLSWLVCSKPSQAESLSKHLGGWADYCLQNRAKPRAYRSIWVAGLISVFKTEPSREPIEASGWLGIVFKTEPSLSKHLGGWAGYCIQKGPGEPKAWLGLVES
jgi:hypothetical protein